MRLLTYTRSIFGRTQRGRRGQSLVEFAFVAPLFFLMIFGITDFGRLFFTKQTLQFALREAGRYAVTGQHLPGVDPNTGSAYTRVASIKKIASDKAAGLNVSNIDVKAYNSNGQPDAVHPAGLPGETVVISLATDLTLITPFVGRYFPNGKYTFTVSTTFRNEPFDIADAD